MLAPSAMFTLIGLSSVTTILSSRKRLALTALRLGAAAFIMVATGTTLAQTKSATATTLTITAGASPVTTVTPGTVVTLTATVKAGASPVTPGLVNFCDASALSCTDIHRLGTAALNSAGVATFRFAPGAGAKSFKAEFNANADGGASSSAASALTVSPARSIVFSDLTTITSTGFPGNYSLTATFVGFGGSAPPSGNISFLDTSFGNKSLATAPLGASITGTGWLLSQTPAANVAVLPELSGDFNGDGIPDLAVPNPTDSNTATITILVGKGDGSFTTGPVTVATVATGDTLQNMVAGDFNGDGKLDLALVGSSGFTTYNLVVLLGNNDGTFPQSETSQGTWTGNPVLSGLIVADFNGDGKLDLGVNSANTVSIALGNGDGTFRSTTSGITAAQDLGQIAAGDFNGDGIPDIVADVADTNQAQVFLGKGDGTFTAVAVSITKELFPGPIIVGDFNGDGRLDLAFSIGPYVMVFLGKGDGTFEQAPKSPVEGNGDSVVAGDFNHDGKLDLAGFDDSANLIDVFMGAGDGTFAEAVTAPALNVSSFTGARLVAADFNGDGSTDLAFSAQHQPTTLILLAQPTQTATATVTGIAPVGAATHNVVASFAGDGNYPAGVSTPLALTAGLAPLVITPSAGIYTTPQTLTMTESVPGATIYYAAGGPVTTPGNGFSVYTGPIPVNEGGVEYLQAYATETGYEQSLQTGLTFTVSLPPAPAPAISVAPGKYATAQTVTISDPVQGATIYYTTNGSQPTASPYPYTGPATPTSVYTGPITVNASETVVASAIAPGYSMSAPTSAQYLIGASATSFIYTVAGNGTPGWTGDGGSATLAELSDPGAAALDSAGNLYIADIGNQRVRKVAAGTHIITTVAGNGAPGYSGDNGPAAQAQLNYPDGVAVDSVGNLYISDSVNSVIRKVSAATGVITTFAGNGTAGFSGDGGPATSAELGGPRSLTFDTAGNLYISDSSRIRKVTVGTGVISTVAGGSQSYLSSGDNGPATSAYLATPIGVALDSAGNIYIADSAANAIRKVTAATGVITTVAGTPSPGQQGIYPAGYTGDGGPATSALLNQPTSVGVDSAGNLYIVDSGNQVIRKVTAATGIITTVVGNGSGCSASSGDGGAALSAQLCASGPYEPGAGAAYSGLILDGAGNLYITDNYSNRIREVTLSAAPPTAAAAAPVLSLSPGSYTNVQTISITDSTPGAAIYLSLTGAPASTASPGYNGPVVATGTVTIQAVAVAPGYVVSSPVSGTYTIGTPQTATISTIAGSGRYGPGGDGPATSAQFGTGIAIALNKAGDVYFTDISNNRVWKLSASTHQVSVFAGTGTQYYSGDGGPATSADLNYPAALAVDSIGNVYIGDEDNEVIRKVDVTTGLISTFAGTYNRLEGATQQSIGDGGPASAAFLSPSDLAFDRDDNLYVVDSDHSLIRKISAGTEIITTVAGTLSSTGFGGYSGDGGPATSAQLSNPRQIAIDSAGNFYFSDQSISRIREVVAATGIIKTIAGNGSAGMSGDGGPATAANLTSRGLAVDGAGALYISNFGAEIRKIDPATGIISRYTGNSYQGYFGDGGSPSLAEINVPEGLSFDSSGSLYLIDSGNYRIRKVAFITPAATPVFSPAGGTYSTPQSVTITDSTAGAAIYYTTDGTTPTTGSSLYSGAIPVGSPTETLKAIVVATGFSQSPEASATYTISQLNTPVITWATPAPINYGVPLSAAQLNATATVAGSFVYSPAAGTVLSAGQQTLNVTFTPTDTTHYSTSTASVTLTVDAATAALSAVSSSANPSLVSSPVTFTATVTATAGTPGGSIAFFDGSTQLGSGALSAGTASITTSALAAGSHAITAVYSGDTNFASVTSAVLTQVVQTFSIGTASGGSSSATVAPGGKATYSLAVTPPSTGAPVTFAVTGLPAGATATFAPPSVPAGAGLTNVTLTVNMPVSAKLQPAASPFGHPGLPLTLALLLLPFAGRLRNKSQRWLGLIVLGVVGITMAAGMSGCGGGSTGSGGTTPPPMSQTYTLTVTATSGSLTESTTLTLIVN